jgi:hypothetical protein
VVGVTTLTWVKCCGSLICFNINIITLLTLFRIAKNRRSYRLGGALYYYPVDNDGDNEEFQKTKEAHYLVVLIGSGNMW